MEQENDMAALCIESRNVGTFESIATDTSRREIPKFGSAAVLPRNDMVYLERCWIKRRWQLTVFTASAGPLPNLAYEIGVQCA